MVYSNSALKYIRWGCKQESTIHPQSWYNNAILGNEVQHISNQIGSGNPETNGFDCDTMDGLHYSQHLKPPINLGLSYETSLDDEETFWALYMFCEQHEKEKENIQLCSKHSLDKFGQFKTQKLTPSHPSMISEKIPKMTLDMNNSRLTNSSLGNEKVSSEAVPTPTKRLKICKKARTNKSGAKTNAESCAVIRPLTAYNYFFRDERQRIISGTRIKGDMDDDNRKQLLLQQHLTKDRSKPRLHRKTHGKIDFKTLTRLIVKRWKSMAKEHKQFYYDIAKMDSDRYTQSLKKIKSSKSSA